MTSSALLVVNTNSRSGERLCASLGDLLAARGIDPLHAHCESREALPQAILDNADKIDCVVIAGGDGTLNAAAPGLLQSGLPLGIIPAGTANDLARTLGIPDDPVDALDIIARGEERRVDLGRVNDQLFFNVASIGLSVALARAMSRETKRRFGRLSYSLAALRVMTRARPFSALIVSEGEVARVRTLQVAVGNGRYYGGGNAVEKSAEIDDGHLDLYSLEVDAVWKLAWMARSFRAGEHGAFREVRSVRGRNFEIHTRRPRRVNADGEILTTTPAKFAIVPKAIRVFAPSSGTG
ncbi:MAG TPA: lipid kinase [Beijerinckiaceae bacterium]|jgi:diacylglycerol kinase (ATP)|nr:lipid kinase [Beijerinckiaceae bacterium]